MSKLRMDPTLATAIVKVVRYLAHSEEMHWDECGQPDDHIYHSIRTMVEWCQLEPQLAIELQKQARDDTRQTLREVGPVIEQHFPEIVEGLRETEQQQSDDIERMEEDEK